MARRCGSKVKKSKALPLAAVRKIVFAKNK
jgi:hypothetical protein